MGRLFSEWWGLIAAFVGIALLVFGLVLLLSGDGDRQQRIDSFSRQCAQEGGHIYAPDRAMWCLKDGLIVEIYP